MLPSIGRCVMSGCAMRRASTCGSSKPADFPEAGAALIVGSATFLLSSHLADEAIDNKRAGDALGLRVEIRENAMCQHRQRHRFQIFHAHEITSLQDRVRFRAAN